MVIRRFRGDSFNRQAVRQVAAVKNGIEEELTAIGVEWRDYFNDVVSSWKNKPRFIIHYATNDREITLEVYAVGNAADVWGWINRGTGKWGAKGQPYPIRPKQPGYPLKFRGGYNPRTKPVAMYDVGNGKASGEWRSPMEVMHPGIEPRKFDEAAQENIKPYFRRRINNSIRREVRKIR